MDRIRVGVIGSGGIYRSLHVPYFEMTDRATIVAVADVNEESARQEAARFGAEAYTDYRKLLERDDVDAVDVCTHPAPHRDITIAAVQAKKHVLLEKPMCRTVAEADAMIAAAKQHGVLVQVAYMMRFHPTFEKLKSLLDAGTLGDLHLAYCCQVGWFSPRHPWLFIREQSGGMLVEQAIHVFDLWLYLYGPVKSVYAQTSHVPLGGTYPEPGKAVENVAAVAMEFGRGGTGVLMKSWAARLGHSGQGVVCSKGSATIGEGLEWQTHGAETAESFVPPVPDDSTYRTDSVKNRDSRYWSYASKGRGIEHWLKCIAGEEQPTTGADVGRAGIEIGEAAYRSAETGQPVSLPL